MYQLFHANSRIKKLCAFRVWAASRRKGKVEAHRAETADRQQGMLFLICSQWAKPASSYRCRGTGSGAMLLFKFAVNNSESSVLAGRESQWGCQPWGRALCYDAHWQHTTCLCFNSASTFCRVAMCFTGASLLSTPPPHWQMENLQKPHLLVWKYTAHGRSSLSGGRWHRHTSQEFLPFTPGAICSTGVMSLLCELLTLENW